MRYVRWLFEMFTNQLRNEATFVKVAVDLTPIYDHLTGIERYNINITKELIKQYRGDQYVLVFKEEVHKEFEDIVKQSNVQFFVLKECNKLWFTQFRLLAAMNRIEADFYLFLSFTSPVFFKKERTISAIHDLTCWDCPESIPTKMKYYYRWTFKAAAKNDWKTVTVSKFSQNRICDKYGLKREDVPVIYDGLSEVFRTQSKVDKRAICNKYGIPEDYILSLSTVEPRKNMQLLISAYQELDNEFLPDLVLAGRKGWKLDEIISSVNPNSRNKIHFTGFVADEDLPGLYASAKLFVFPSKYEGFGLPLIEAMSQRVLVLSSDAASLPEVVDVHGILFESDSIESLKAEMLYCLSLSKYEREKIVNAAQLAAYRFNWGREAKKLHRIMTSGLD